MSEASKLIRDSIAAVPEELRQQRWVVHSMPVDRGEIDSERVSVHANADGLIVTEQDEMYAGREVAAFLALMDPTVAAAVAALLDTLHRAAAEEPENDPADVVHGWAEMQALESAITRTGGTS